MRRDQIPPFLAGALQTGKYALFPVCPATANTTTKIVHGIADTLISNCVSQALKTNQKLYIYPVDQKPSKVTTLLHGGEELTLTIRAIGIENPKKLKTMKGITVLAQPEDIKALIEHKSTQQ